MLKNLKTTGWESMSKKPYMRRTKEELVNRLAGVEGSLCMVKGENLKQKDLIRKLENEIEMWKRQQRTEAEAVGSLIKENEQLREELEELKAMGKITLKRMEAETERADEAWAMVARVKGEREGVLNCYKILLEAMPSGGGYCCE
jgi:hypothetical protein